MKGIKKIIRALPWALSIIAIIAAAAFFVYVSNELGNGSDNEFEAKKEFYENEIAELQEESVSLQSTIDSLQSTKDSLKSTVDSLQSTIDSLREKLDSKYSEDALRWEMEEKAEEMKRLIDAMPADAPDAIDVIATDLFYVGSGEIRQLRYNGTEFLPFITPYIEIEIGDYTYCKCDMLYSDIVKIYSEIFTGDALEEYLGHMYVDVDGYLYSILGGGGSGTGFGNVSLTRVSETANEIKYNVSYSHNFDVETFETCTMTIRLVNGSWRISEIDYLADFW